MKEIDEREQAVFEAGIKLGALYHQFVGTPLNTETIDGLSRAIEQSIALQPYVQSVSVSIDREMVKKKQNTVFGYCELEGKMLRVNLQIQYRDTTAYAELAYDEERDYPLMRIKKISSTPRILHR